MENNLPENSVQYQAYVLSKEFDKIELEFSEKFKEFVEQFVEQFPKYPVDEQYTWKDENGNNILK